MTETQVFHITQAAPGHGWFWVFLVAMVLVMAGVMVFVGWVVNGAKHARFEVSERGLEIRGGLYGRLIPLEHLELDQARVADLDTDTELYPKRRRSGSSLPGLRAGWFTLRSGDKAYCFLTDLHRVAYLPTTEGFVLLLSVDDPAALINALRAAASKG